MPSLTPQSFVARWRASTLTERASAQSHFNDLCALLGVPTPTEADPTGTTYTFERGVARQGGGQGWADVWKRGAFAWEYKSRHRNLDRAYQQLLQYREALENPPLLVVSDIETIQVHTNFTNTVKRVVTFSLDDLLEPARLDQLRRVWSDPESFRAEQTSEQVTEVAAREFARLAELLRAGGHPPERAARFLIRLLFCLFAEDVGLLPSALFSRLIAASARRPDTFTPRLRQLFAAMQQGGIFGAEDIARFNGGLFDDDAVIELPREGLALLDEVTRLDWSSIEPAIFGTLFERSLDPSKRAQLGAHYTSRSDILLIVEPVLMAPLRRRWAEVQREALALAAGRGEADTPRKRDNRTQELLALLQGFTQELASVRVLDPAAGSGNFLYVALKQLLDLEKEVIVFAGELTGQHFFPSVSPEQLRGIEVNEYAHELAQTTIWIGYIQWLRDNGFGAPSEPILKAIQTIQRMDALMDHDARGRPVEPPWPEADVIIGNPPFLGGKKLRTELGDRYVDDLFALYGGRVPREADLVTYWFERARKKIAQGEAKRAGLIATQAIRGGANRRVLEGIKATGDIFFAWSDRDWILDGATVHVSMVGFDDGRERPRLLDGAESETINPDLTGAADLTQATRLAENTGLAFMGDTKGGAFDIPAELAERLLRATGNPNGRPNRDVIRPWVNGLDVTRRPRGMAIIDFGTEMSEEQASLYEAPFEYVRQQVKPARERSRSTRAEWWMHERPRPELRAALAPLERYIATPTVAKHRLFVWMTHPTLPDHQLIAIARDDDYFFGVLHSRLHELWARRQGTQLREATSGSRYTPTTTFETFPFPWPPGVEPRDDPRVEAIAQAARELVARRDAWLNPEGATEEERKRRTLTALYNQRPTWLDLAHRRLDAAVLAAYGWPADLSDEALLERLLALNLERAAAGNEPRG